MPYLDGVYYNDGAADDRAALKASQDANRRANAEAADARKRAAAEEKRANEMHALETARLAREAEIKKQQGIVGAEWAVEFLGEWNKDRENLTGMVNDAFADVDKAWESIESGKQWLTDLESHKSLVGQEYENFREQYKDLEAEAKQTQMEGLGTQRGLMSKIRDLSHADLQGVSSRAKADVGSESEKARRAEERRLQSMGMSPESGRSRSAMNKSYVDEALSKVLAANRSRAIEKERAAGVAMGGLSTINPAQAGGISSGIRSQGLDYLKEMTNIGAQGLAGATNLAQAGGQLAGQKGNLADIYGRNVVQPMGEAGMSMLGTAMKAGPENLSGRAGEVSVPSYAVGTGPAGLPETGLYFGHKGEIVKNPQESAAERWDSGYGQPVLNQGMGNPYQAPVAGDRFQRYYNRGGGVTGIPPAAEIGNFYQDIARRQVYDGGQIGRPTADQGMGRMHDQVGGGMPIVDQGMGNPYRQPVLGREDRDVTGVPQIGPGRQMRDLAGVDVRQPIVSKPYPGELQGPSLGLINPTADQGMGRMYGQVADQEMERRRIRLAEQRAEQERPATKNMYARHAPEASPRRDVPQKTRRSVGGSYGKPTVAKDFGGSMFREPQQKRRPVGGNKISGGFASPNKAGAGSGFRGRTPKPQQKILSGLASPNKAGAGSGFRAEPQQKKVATRFTSTV